MESGTGPQAKGGYDTTRRWQRRRTIVRSTSYTWVMTEDCVKARKENPSTVFKTRTKRFLSQKTQEKISIAYAVPGDI
eukprot:6185500-Pleurochrysis_carterae.AAC.2